MNIYERCKGDRKLLSYVRKLINEEEEKLYFVTSVHILRKL